MTTPASSGRFLGGNRVLAPAHAGWSDADGLRLDLFVVLPKHLDQPVLSNFVGGFLGRLLVRWPGVCGLFHSHLSVLVQLTYIIYPSPGSLSICYTGSMSGLASSPFKPLPINMKGVRSGYVYVAQSPDRPDICKVGHTTRPPHVRMGELGKTTWLSPMWVNSARFFWDAISTEKSLHRYLSDFACSGTEEWFAVPSSQVGGLLNEWPQEICPPRRRTHFGDRNDPQWLSTRLDWATDLISSTLAIEQKEGWRDVERLSALGYAPATWLIVERLIVEDACPDHILWVLDAANTQGHPGARLRRDWVASLTRQDPTRRQWRERVRNFVESNPDPIDWSAEDRDTLLSELSIWARRPSMAWMDELPGLLAQDTRDMGSTPTP